MFYYIVLLSIVLFIYRYRTKIRLYFDILWWYISRKVDSHVYDTLIIPKIDDKNITLEELISMGYTMIKAKGVSEYYKIDYRSGFIPKIYFNSDRDKMIYARKYERAKETILEVEID